MIWAPDYPRATSNGYVREHIMVWEKANGPLPDEHIVHHLNGLRADNRIENLAALMRSEHKSWTLIELLHVRIRDLEAALAAR